MGMGLTSSSSVPGGEESELAWYARESSVAVVMKKTPARFVRADPWRSTAASAAATCRADGRAWSRPRGGSRSSPSVDSASSQS
eukprot:6001205-Heterocapsa_arctica.AAC.1